MVDIEFLKKDTGLFFTIFSKKSPLIWKKPGKMGADMHSIHRKDNPLFL